MAALKLPGDGLTRDTITTSATKEDYAWIKDGSSFSESQTFYMFLPDNSMVMYQLAYSEVGINPMVQLSFRLYDPSRKADAVRTLLCQTLSAKRFELSKDRCSVTCEAASISYMQDDGAFRVVYKPTGDKPFSCDILLTIIGHGVKVGSGVTDLGDNVTIKRVLIPRLSAEGIIKIRGMTVPVQRAYASMFREYFSTRPHQISVCGKLWMFHSDGLSVLSIQHVCIKDRGVTNEGAIYYNGKVVGACNNMISPVKTEGTVDPDTGYVVPQKVNFVHEGPGGFECRFKWEKSADSLIDRIDVLSMLPFLIRKVVQYMVSKPFLYHFYSATIEGSVKRSESADPVTESGRAFFEQFYLNPAS